MGVTEGFARYWTTKLLNPNFHPGSHGGARDSRSRFDANELLFVEWLLLAAIRFNPLQTIGQLRSVLQSFGVDIAENWIKRTFHRWGWSCKHPRYKQINKFTMDNMLYTGHFLWEVRGRSPIQLKYLDESHFDSKELRPSRGWSESGRRLAVPSAASISERYSITAVTTLVDPNEPVVISNLREVSNTALDFLSTVQELIEYGTLVPGDWLICECS